MDLVSNLAQSIDSELRELDVGASSPVILSRSTPQREFSAQQRAADFHTSTTQLWKHHATNSSLSALEGSTVGEGSQRRRVESILRSFSSSKPHSSPQAQGTDGASYGGSAAAMGSGSLSMTLVDVPRHGTTDRMLLAQSQNEVVALRNALLAATETLQKVQGEARNERSLRLQLRDELDRAKRQLDTERERYEVLERDLHATQAAASRREETQTTAVEHHQRIAEQLSAQLKAMESLRDEWRHSCAQKEQEIGRFTAALRDGKEERKRLQSVLDTLRAEHQKLLEFVDGPLFLFAKDAARMRETWSSIEVDSLGMISPGKRPQVERSTSNNIRKHPVDPHDLSASPMLRPSAWRDGVTRLSPKAGERHGKQQEVRAVRKFVEKLFSDAAIDRRVAEVLQRVSPQRHRSFTSSSSSPSTSEEEDTIGKSTSSSLEGTRRYPL